MTTSLYGGRVRTPAGRLDYTNDVSSRALRKLVSNAHHYADQKCHSLVSWVAPTGRFREPTTATTDFARLAMYGPLPLTLRDDYAAYSLRLELAGASASAGTGVTFGAVVVPSIVLGTDFVNDSALITGSGAIFTTTTSITPAWLTTSAGTKFFDLAPSVIDAGFGVRSTLTDTGGEPTEVETCEVWLVVYARTANIAVKPRLFGVHLSEYVGA